MKKIITQTLMLCLFLVISIGASAQSKYIVFQNDGNKVNCSFNEHPKLVFANDVWTLETAEDGVKDLDTLKKVVFRPVLKGDANVDETVDVADITGIASFILGVPPEEFLKENADVNEDKSIDVADITGTASIILNQTSK